MGVDLIPPKTCTYDCLYCEVGRTTCHTIDAGPLVPLNELLKELKLVLRKNQPDTITLAGSGEPTLNSEIDRIISSIKEMTAVKTALLTNGSLFWNDEILQKVLDADIILPTLSTAFEETHNKIHRPCQGLNLSRIIGGIKQLRKRYQGLMFLEVVLLSGINDTEREIEGLKTVINEISPDKIQLNTIIRPPSDLRAIPVDMTRMNQIKDFLGDKAEIIAYRPSDKKTTEYDSGSLSIIEMSRRRPVRLVDIADALNMPLEEAGRLIKGMLIKGDISKREHEGEIFYVARQHSNEVYSITK